ncbi:HD domain-containing protein [Mycolicibacterium sp. 120270]|uniref:HD domain-containing protein n=1 Tax=Mycolicibacterium sp. 120270 TaxID=3090600 RepID=UPI0039AF0A5C
MDYDEYGKRDTAGERRNIVTNTITSLAAGIADSAHAGQRDKAGQPYIGHVRRVASYIDDPHDTAAVAAALLHDTLEDTPITAADLADRGIPAQVIAAVELLTRRENQSPADYYAQIRQHRIAREVKLADLADNTDPDRLAMLPETRRTRLLHKYANAYRALGANPADGHRRRAAHRRRVPG